MTTVKLYKALLLISLLIVISTVSVAQITNPGSDISEELDLSSRTIEVQAGIRNAFGVPELTIDTFRDPEQAQQYGVAVAQTIIPGILLAVISLLSLFAVFFIQCCGCCNGRNLTYSKMAVRVHGGLVAGAAVAIITLVSVAIFYNSELSGSISGPTGVTTSVNAIAPEVNGFLEEVQTFALGIADSIPGAVDDIEAVLGNVNDVVGSTSRITDGLTDVEMDLRTNDANYTCGPCTSLADEVQNVNDQITMLADPVVQEVGNSVNSIQDSLVTAGDEISSTIRTAVEPIDEVQQNILDIEASFITPFTSAVDQYEPVRNSFYVLAFIIPFFLLIFAGIGYILTKPFFVKLAMYGLYIMAIFYSLLFAFQIPVSLLIADSCGVLTEQENSGGIYTQALVSCINDVSLGEAFNLSDQLSFRDQITIPEFSLGEIEQAFNFTELDDFNDQISNLSLSDFGVNSSEIDEGLFRFNNDPNLANPGAPFYDRSNISMAVGADGPDPAAREQARDILVGLIEIETQAITTLDEVQMGTNNVVETSNEVFQNISSLNSDIQALAPTVIEPLFGQVDTFIQDLSCGGIGEIYVDMKNSVCTTMTVSLALLGFVSFLIAVIALLTNIVLFRLSNRLSAASGTSTMPMKDNAVQYRY
jgi:hypothetical protein